MFMELDSSFITDLKQELVGQISFAKSDLLSVFPIDVYIHLLDHIRTYGGYSSFPKEAHEVCNEIVRQAGRQVLENYHRLVLLSLIEGFGHRLSQRRMPVSMVHLFAKEFQRIISEMKVDREDFYLLPNDAFVKELGICRLKLYPCGPELVDELSGAPRSMLLKGEAGQLLEKLKFFGLTLRGFRPLYELHMHAPLREFFNPEGWTGCYCRIAELLKLNPNVKGLSCTSWWYDPQLQAISPRLSYLRKQPTEGGARIFYVGVDKDATSGAIAKSQTRRQLYHAGKYVPHVYMMIWARDDLIAWAEKAHDTWDEP